MIFKVEGVKLEIFYSCMFIVVRYLEVVWFYFGVVEEVREVYRKMYVMYLVQLLMFLIVRIDLDIVVLEVIKNLERVGFGFYMVMIMEI